MWKYLGVIVDGKLSCKGHCKLLCCIIFKYVGAMYKVKCYVNDHTLRMLYHSLRFFNVFRCCHACLILLRCEWEWRRYTMQYVPIVVRNIKTELQNTKSMLHFMRVIVITSFLKGCT